ncbi:Mu-like prophage major head subunit gpT family protein [Xanthomonas nasturtii]|uniref:Mu-like prophage major head subunit gpT family protein n=1 Tax=Xanthomonas nasturtii TaxID=1843581 RepID=A0ABT0LMA7_9XANT|nr:Mu-like prophage major head subunit gpT family protein [Xanthomonas nasturtii]MCL1550465.1 Mu-like prophage major head subunit gpT family protein [Xanthomonas nasturtii]MCL1554745.1 Mu-like prophage major head subunit gpT family protein [Xanthomonas nasturtii]MCL1561323.1 Mu-like prophage major head subunit gpT family protein [Xanthomonas nasturtii]
MIINKGNLTSLHIAFKAAFQGGLGQAPTQYEQFVTVVPSTTGAEEYGWLGQLPNVREWLGDRVINGIQSHGYTIKNKKFELTIAVPRDKIEDDQYGVYTPLFSEMGRATAAHPDQLVFNLLKSGPTTLCYDGQNFFDTDHPVINEDGTVGVQSNWDNNAGAGLAWYLVDNSRAIKPIILQNRKLPNFVAKTSDTDDNVFDKDEYVYGSDSRRNVGFGFWQMAYGSRKPLTEENLIAAYTEFTSRKGDHGRPLGLKPTHLVVAPAQKFTAAKLVSATTLANGAENVLKGLVKVEDVAWLS